MSGPSALLLTAAALVQVTLLGRLDPAIPEPNLVLALVVSRAFVCGSRSGMVWGLAGGLMLDLAGTGPLGVHALAMLAAAYTAGLLAAAFDSRRSSLAALAAAAGAACYSVVVLGAADSLGLADVTIRTALPLVAGGAAACALLTVPAALLMRRLAGTREVPQW
jgi:rod shape-determining protein MreD